MNPIRATDYPDVYVDLGIDTGDLGCIMLDTERLVISDIVPNDVLWLDADDPDSHTQGNVSESEPHATLLYGLLSSGPAMRKHVDRVLDLIDGGEYPPYLMQPLSIANVSFFYGKSPDYVTIIALLDVTPGLTEANQRLQLLPHINTFGEYRPHITLAYVKSDADWETMVHDLNEKYMGTGVNPIGINYGDA